MDAISYDGTRLHYEIAGPDHGEALLLSNSLGTDLALWDAQLTSFSEHFRVIRYDSRGHGRSDAPAGEYTIEMLGRDALAVLDTVGVRRGHVLGLSMGGMVGQWLAGNAPEVVDRLVLANTSAHIPPAGWRARIETVLSKGIGAIVPTVLDLWFTKPFQESHPAEVDRIRRMIAATPDAGYAACCAAIRDMDQRGNLSVIQAPTLVIAGREDRSTPPVMAEEIAQGIARAKLLVLDHAAHLSNVEQAGPFNRAVLEFLGVGAHRAG